MRIKNSVAFASIIIFIICVYSFLLGNNVFEGKFENEPIPWYFLAKGLFCGIALYLLAIIAEKLTDKK
ncbi:MAG: hypothetical protein NTZ92_05590 [Candidatus Omnitrophica bacterium]|nr:hypothetical protein [Candidatus Omnitrophota bacterium]